MPMEQKPVGGAPEPMRWEPPEPSGLTSWRSRPALRLAAGELSRTSGHRRPRELPQSRCRPKRRPLHAIRVGRRACQGAQAVSREAASSTPSRPVWRPGRHRPVPSAWQKEPACRRAEQPNPACAAGPFPDTIVSHVTEATAALGAAPWVPEADRPQPRLSLLMMSQPRTGVCHRPARTEPRPATRYPYARLPLSMTWPAPATYRQECP